MENGQFEDVFPIQDGDFPLLCLFTGGYYLLLEPEKNPLIRCGDLLMALQHIGTQDSLANYGIFKCQKLL